MPVYHCRRPGCQALIPRSGFCEAHAADAEAARQSTYDRTRRDAESKKFYSSKSWSAVRRQVLERSPVCQRCQRAPATAVHHSIPLRQCNHAQRLDPSLLVATCQPCHMTTEAELRREIDAGEPERPHIAGTLTIEADDTFRFDPELADRPCRFVEKYCRHAEGRFAGQPFHLLPWQRSIVRTLFGWVHRTTGLRRFRELYIISAKGSGKTPLLAAIGLFCLIAEGEASPHVVSMAATFEQARLTFDAAKSFIRESPDLSRHAESIQYAIRTRKGGKWTTISGRPTGRSGPRPSCIVADEVHEWPGPTAAAYELLCANLFKRSQPLLLVATNAGASRSTFAWNLHDRACKVLAGKLDDPTLLPCIFEAPPDVQWDSEAAARAANPSLGSVVQWSQLQPAVARARESAAAETTYRRLYLSQWKGGNAAWLSMDRWDACTAPVDLEKLHDADLFVGVDLSGGDDLCAAVSIYVTPDRWHVTGRAWLPRVTAEKYERTEGHTYRAWADAGAIDLLPETTITPAVQSRIAQAIIDQHKLHPITAVVFDRYRADAVIAQIEAAGITCIPLAQGYSLSPGCVEVERRLTAGTINVEPNPVMRAHAETVEVTQDQRGNIWPVKPGARGKWKGRPGAKVDLIAALVTAAAEVQRRAAKPTPAAWDGSIVMV